MLATVQNGGIAIAVALALVLIFGAIFCLATWSLMKRHAPKRPWAASAREFVRELWWILLTQPIAPLFFWLGRGTPKPTVGDIPVVFVHGYFQNRVAFVYLIRALRRAGHVNQFSLNYPWWSPIDQNAVRLAHFVSWVRSVCKATQVDLVCHSMGGLVALDYITHHGGRESVRRCVTIASPHQGVVYRGPMLGRAAQDLRARSPYLLARATQAISIPCLSIASRHDNVVFPAERASIAHRGGYDALIDDRGHLAILFDDRVAELTAEFLDIEAAPNATGEGSSTTEPPTLALL